MGVAIALRKPVRSFISEANVIYWKNLDTRGIEFAAIQVATHKHIVQARVGDTYTDKLLYYVNDEAKARADIQRWDEAWVAVDVPSEGDNS